MLSPSSLAALGSVYRIATSVDGSVRGRRGLSYNPEVLIVKAPVLMGRDGVSLPSDGKLTPSIQSWHSPK